MSEGELYNIERILDRRKVKGKYEYKIKWEGYPMNQSTWEPLENLETAKLLVEEYDKTHPFKDSKKEMKSRQLEKVDQLTNRKRKNSKKEKEENNQDNFTPKENNNMKEIEKINIEKSESNNNDEDTYKKNYTIDDSLIKVITVKQQDQKLMAVVEKIESNGEIVKNLIPTEELRKNNPWILLDFY